MLEALLGIAHHFLYRPAAAAGRLRSAFINDRLPECMWMDVLSYLEIYEYHRFFVSVFPVGGRLQRHMVTVHMRTSGMHIDMYSNFFWFDGEVYVYDFTQWPSDISKQDYTDLFKAWVAIELGLVPYVILYLPQKFRASALSKLSTWIPPSCTIVLE